MRFHGALGAIAATGLLAVVLIAMSVLDAPWLAYLAIALLAMALVAQTSPPCAEVSARSGRSPPPPPSGETHLGAQPMDF